jgi:DNA-binding NarL/FixJ family response regulator
MQSSRTNQPFQLVIYTDDALLSVGATGVLSSSAHWDITNAEPGLFALVPLVEQSRPDMILLDFSPEMSLGLVSSLRRAAPDARLVLWARSFSDELRYQARDLGVAGFLSRGLSKEAFVKNLLALAEGDDVSEAQKPAHSTTVSLTKRESQLVTLLAQGLKNKEIAACIGISEGTVRVYLSKLFAKIGARDRFEVAVFGLKNAFCGQASWDGQNGFVTEGDEGRARPMLKSLVLVEPERRRRYTGQGARAIGA